MRLTEIQKNTIRETVSEVFGADSSVYLFGSRVDDHKRGGDIDLLVVSAHHIDEAFRLSLKTQSRLARRLGEQKIDLITTVKDLDDDRLVVKEALNKGIRL
ncbi:MAG: nucleotidyltransferase domain-containing protein [Spirochaetaceae bacterium]|nr:nucleotidyltransferase domain-containing protein [Spirochaetaceae bacterium]MDT8297444.1 nucleotidyltransferase domain-containing protein [Spirochaetaceae bacterium]